MFADEILTDTRFVKMGPNETKGNAVQQSRARDGREVCIGKQIPNARLIHARWGVRSKERKGSKLEQSEGMWRGKARAAKMGKLFAEEPNCSKERPRSFDR
jgi:hypothetical protein